MVMRQKKDIFAEIDVLHERAQQMASEYEDAPRNGDFSITYRYQEIIGIYGETMKEIVAYDEWDFGSDNDYQVWEARYLTIQQEFRRKSEEDRKLRERRHK
jgi:hypothetical protein